MKKKKRRLTTSSLQSMIHSGQSKVLKYFGIVKHKSVVLDAFAMVVKVMRQDLPNLTWVVEVLVRNFLKNCLVTIPWSTTTSSFAQQMILVAQFEFAKHKFICMAFKSNFEWSYSQRINALTTTIQTTTAGTSQGLNCFGHVIYVRLKYCKTFDSTS